ncbi:extracellular solute-binding protein family 5 [Conexibacter woesei DSM 14684]|uniref:Extracellular solute-binding protein family 5 n=1 Tax=Conexibacter woesei (strain DSM 14684 / CCUG 47730 / CIP 108061 / JCM 11494 / NBRC 100937 / ID131577) TaxID=469383 RepID=D3FAN7_CONWI|nr:extracellular solute-binding protein family 5 [Conexibacter woesei DSM 14684]
MVRLSKSATALAVLVAAWSLAACGGGAKVGDSTSDGGGGASTGASSSGGTLTVGLDSDPASLDPTGDTGYAGSLVTPQIFETLVVADDDGTIGPGLAERWTVSRDGRTYTLTLRKGVRFHDGTPLDARAVVASLRRSAGRASPWAADLAPITAMKATGEDTVVLTLDRPNAPLLSTLADKPGMIASPTAVEQAGRRFGSQPVGTGPFAFDHWTRNQELMLRRNPDYWDAGKPKLDAVVFKPLPDPTQKVTNLVAGQVQTVDYVPPELISRVEGASNLELEQGPGPYNSVVYVPMNAARPPLDDANVRQAVSLAIDRDSIVRNVAFGAGTPARSMLSPTSWGYSDEIPAIPYDPARARTLLGGREVKLELQVPPTYTQAAQVMKQNLAEAGIDVTLRRMDWGQLIDGFYKGDFDMQVQDLLGMQRSDPDGALSSFYAPDGSNNGAGFSDPQITALLDRARSGGDEAQRRPEYVEIQQLAQEQSPYAPVYIPNQVRAWDSKVQGLGLSNDGVLHLTDVTIG